MGGNQLSMWINTAVEPVVLITRDAESESESESPGVVVARPESESESESTRLP